ncbi:MAG: lipoate--protein ligase family protein [Acidimicrobiia bacterium]|nr:lipoate--protein ligase family protein [Acidimicrobiia bacterium]
MTEQWRVIDVTGTTCAESMARMPVLCAEVAAGRSDEVLIIGSFGTTHFNVGWFDDIDEVIDLEACHREGVEVVRRMVFGGGTAFYDGDAAMIVSQIVRADRFPDLDTALDAWQPVVEDAVTRLGLTGARFAGSSDLRWGDDRKLGSFMANSVLGTVAIGGYMNIRHPDMRIYARCAKVPEEKFRDKLVKDHLAYIVTPEEIRGSAIPYAEGKAAFLAAVESVTGRGWYESRPTDDELAGTEDFVQLMASEEQLMRISSRRFVAEAGSDVTTGLAYHKANKLVRAGVALDAGGCIVSALLAGDMIMSPPDVMDRAAAALHHVDSRDVVAVRRALAGVLEAGDVTQADDHMGISVDDVAHAVELAVSDARRST